MKTSNNTVLVTGGGSGIGLETAKLLAQHNNRVIITGRNAAKLEQAAAQHPNISFIACDLTDSVQVDALVKKIKAGHGSLNVLVNNAGMANLHRLGNDTPAIEFARTEISTNYLSVVALTEKLLPLLKQQPEAAIVNVTSIVVFAPSMNLPTYSASKAALNAYTKVLRLTLAQDSNVKVFEVMPPLVDTELAKDIPSDKIAPSVVAEALLGGLANNEYEIHVATTKNLYALFRQSPESALNVLNGLPA